MTARFLWKQRKKLRNIERRARATADPLDRLRFVRSQMDSQELQPASQGWPVSRIAGITVAVLAAAIGAALLLWRIG
ncbi:MAG TPA: hypothetical protein VGF49_00205 [Candidatus Solibacter sp.]|jgi:hypothetical protein